MMNDDKVERLQRYKRQRELYLQAEEEILTGAQSYSIGSRTVTKGSLAEIAKMIAHLDSQITKLENSGGKRPAFRVIPRDI